MFAWLCDGGDSAGIAKLEESIWGNVPANVSMTYLESREEWSSEAQSAAFLAAMGVRA